MEQLVNFQNALQSGAGEGTIYTFFNRIQKCCKTKETNECVTNIFICVVKQKKEYPVAFVKTFLTSALSNIELLCMLLDRVEQWCSEDEKQMESVFEILMRDALFLTNHGQLDSNFLNQLKDALQKNMQRKISNIDCVMQNASAWYQQHSTHESEECHVAMYAHIEKLGQNPMLFALLCQKVCREDYVSHLNYQKSFDAGLDEIKI